MSARDTLAELLEQLDHDVAIPERNCSCHISPPCSDCVEWGGLRNAIEHARAEVKALRDRKEVKLAKAFWELDAEQQAEFFATLHDIAGINLCFQMAAVVREVQQRADRGQHSAMLGFTTIQNHAQDYHDGAAFYRASDAKQAIAKMVKGARHEDR